MTLVSSILSDPVQSVPIQSDSRSVKRRRSNPFLIADGYDIRDLSPAPTVSVSPPRDLPASVQISARSDSYTLLSDDSQVKCKRVKRSRQSTSTASPTRVQTMPASPTRVQTMPVSPTAHSDSTVIQRSHKIHKNKRVQCSPEPCISVRSQTDRSMFPAPSVDVSVDTLPSFWSPRAIARIAQDFPELSAAAILQQMESTTPSQLLPFSPAQRQSMYLCLVAAMWAQRDFSSHVLHVDAGVSHTVTNQQLRCNLMNMSVRPVEGPALIYPSPPVQAFPYSPILAPWSPTLTSSHSTVPVPTIRDLFKNTAVSSEAQLPIRSTSDVFLCSPRSCESTVPERTMSPSIFTNTTVATTAVNISTDSSLSHTTSLDILLPSLDIPFVMEIEGDNVVVTRSSNIALAEDTTTVQSDAVDSQSED